MLDRPVRAVFFEPKRMIGKIRILVMSDEVINAGVFVLKVFDKFQVGLQLRWCEIVGIAFASNVFDPYGTVVEPYDMSGHCRLIHKPVNPAVSVDHKMCRDIKVGCLVDICPVAGEGRSDKAFHRGIEVIAGCPMDHDDTRSDLGLIRIKTIML